MNVINLCENKINQSVIIKSNNRIFILKSMGIGTYGTERVARLFIILPSGEKAIVQTICLLRLIETGNIEGRVKEYDCLIDKVVSFNEAVEISKEVIIKIYE